MASLDTTHVDLECGGGGSPAEKRAMKRVFFGDVDGGSCYSKLYSTANGSYTTDLGAGEFLDSCRASVAAQLDYSVEIGNGKQSERENLEEGGGLVEQDFVEFVMCECRDYGIVIEFGCSCKDDSAAAHKCAETWFKI